MLHHSITALCAQRPRTYPEIEEMVDEIEDAQRQLAYVAVRTQLIGEYVMERLKGRDHVAYVRFASVYRNFQDIDEFAEELRQLERRRSRRAQSENQVELPL